jgi:pantoate--beta-alanine ligase
MSTDDIPTFRTVAALRQLTKAWRAADETIGLVPTMGALHAGHLALVETSVTKCDRTIATIFINPKQFGPSEDLSRYPRRESDDVSLLAAAGVDGVFAPGVDEIYPDTHATSVQVGGVTQLFEGAHRPGHFDGVTTIVCKLLLQALPDYAYFGEKDFQQLVTIKRMVEDLNIPVEITGVKTIREEDGLALSSRNEYLDTNQRMIAPSLYRILRATADEISSGIPVQQAVATAEQTLLDAGFDGVDYLDCVNSLTFEPISMLKRPARLIAAAHLGRTRLIDNLSLS